MIRASAFTLAALVAAATAACAEDASPARSVWDGVYTEAQAERGAAIYAEHCALCHAENFAGAPGSPPLRGPAFTYLWNGENLGALFEVVRTTMPSGQAGLLSDQEYLDAIAAVLQANEMPAASDGPGLAPDADLLAFITITPTP